MSTPVPRPNALVARPAFAEWHPTRNELDPSTLTVGQHHRVWWLCATCGHEWEATVIARARPVRPSGCPACAHRLARERQSTTGVTRNPLSNHPVAAEWHPSKNGDLTPEMIAAGGRTQVWWLGECGHEWQTRVSHRTGPKPSGCPECAPHAMGKRSSTNAATLNPLSNHPVAAEFHPTRNDDLTPAHVSAGARRIVWWKCAHGHEWQAKISNRTRTNPVGCPTCAARTHGTLLKASGAAMPRENLASHPIATEWHPTRNGAQSPEELTAGSNRKVWWLCRCGHEWEARVANRTKDHRPSGCPACAQRSKSVLRRTTTATANPLSTHPAAAEWHPARNGALTPDRVAVGSGQRVWWLCENGHEWQAQVHNRTNPDPSQSTGCPECAPTQMGAARATAAATANPLSNHPVAAEWHPTRNDVLAPADVAVGSHRPVWWLCARGHAWQTTPHHRTRTDRPSGCPTCGTESAAAALRLIRATTHWS